MKCENCNANLIIILEEALGRTTVCPKCEKQWDRNWHNQTNRLDWIYEGAD